MVTKNYWVSGLFPSSNILVNRKHDVSETGSVSVLRWRGEKTPIQLGPLERANLQSSDWDSLFLRAPNEQHLKRKPDWPHQTVPLFLHSLSVAAEMLTQPLPRNGRIILVPLFWPSEVMSQYIRVEGSAIVQAVSRWLPTAAAWVQTRVWSSGICGGQSGVGAGFLRVLRFPLPIFIPPNSPSSKSSGEGTIGHSVVDVPSGPNLVSTPHYANIRVYQDYKQLWRRICAHRFIALRSSKKLL
jgi:hypothetical protein